MQNSNNNSSSNSNGNISFPFPYPPYPVQISLMNNIFECVKNNGTTRDIQNKGQKYVNHTNNHLIPLDKCCSVGIFESPTGTGKTLSIINSLLYWLLEYLPKTKQSNNNNINTNTSVISSDSSTPSWIFNQSNSESSSNQEIQSMQRLKNRIRAYERNGKSPLQNTNFNHRNTQIKRKQASDYNGKSKKDKEILEDSELIVEFDTALDSTTSNIETKQEPEWKRILAENDRNLLEVRNRLQLERESIESINDLPVVNPQIIYTSRTHSQLIQFVEEIRKTKYKDEVRVISLGSRKQLCINDSVLELGSSVKINDQCAELQKKKEKTSSKQQKTTNNNINNSSIKPPNSGGCPYMEASTMAIVRDFALNSVHSSEELEELGRLHSGCPYYSSRQAIQSAHILTVPYQMLIHSTTRNLLGINLHNTVIVIDEAHNLIESINAIYSNQITLNQLQQAHKQLTNYKEKYEKRFKPITLQWLNMLIQVVGNLGNYLWNSANKTTNNNNNNNNNNIYNSSSNTNQNIMVYKILDFESSAGIAGSHYWRLTEFIEKSELPKKLNGFNDKYNEFIINHNENDEYTARNISVLSAIAEFFNALKNSDSNGRVIVEAQSNKPVIRFLMLNPAVHLTEILTSCRSLILTGGTMKPFNHYISQLFPLVPPVKLHNFSCGHVVSSDNILAISLSKGPGNVPLSYNYSNRNNADLMKETGNIILNLSRIVPDGIVVFFSSYSYEKEVMECWNTHNLIKQIEKKKKIFRENGSNNSTNNNNNQSNNSSTSTSGVVTDSILNSYSDYIHNMNNSRNVNNHTGAILTSVVGGKLSEGINFKDELARCVVMVGLPYPNKMDIELVEKMKYLDSQSTGSGAIYYETLCMRAVNQSIGRSIRHINDYSTIILLDERYKQSSIQLALPNWLTQNNRMIIADNFGKIPQELKQFFDQKKPK